MPSKIRIDYELATRSTKAKIPAKTISYETIEDLTKALSNESERLAGIFEVPICTDYVIEIGSGGYVLRVRGSFHSRDPHLVAGALTGTVEKPKRRTHVFRGAQEG